MHLLKSSAVVAQRLPNVLNLCISFDFCEPHLRDLLTLKHLIYVLIEVLYDWGRMTTKLWLNICTFLGALASLRCFIIDVKASPSLVLQPSHENSIGH
jgi:hypothetical protein